MSSFSRLSQKIDWWITSWCHCGRLVTISEMIVSACLHISVIDSPNPKHSPLSTSCDETLDWNHSRWGGVWPICYLLPARRRTAPTSFHNPLPPPCQPPPLSRTLTGRIFATRTHYGNQTKCVYRNQSADKPIAGIMTQQSLFVTFDWWSALHCLSVWMGKQDNLTDRRDQQRWSWYSLNIRVVGEDSALREKMLCPGKAGFSIYSW